METHTKEERELYDRKRIEVELSGWKSAGTLMCANAIVIEQEQANSHESKYWWQCGGCGGGDGAGGSGGDNNGDIGGSCEEQLTSLTDNIVLDLTITDSE